MTMTHVHRQVWRVLIGTVCLAALSCPVQSQPKQGLPTPKEGPGYMLRAHSHNDYEHSRPLLDALDQRFYSVEADIWLEEGSLLVSHHAGDYKGSLKDLYLDPLQEKVNKKGSVYGDGENFLLWIDIKDGDPDLNIALEKLLSNYPMLTVFTDEKVTQGPVTAILTGDTESKMRHMTQFPVRHACRDGGYGKDDPPADNRWTWIAANFGNYVQLSDQGEIPEDQFADLVLMVSDIHSKGRKVRFWANPDDPQYWYLALSIGIDLINTDQLEELRAFLTNPKMGEADSPGKP
jgi:hypothetical protein